MVLSCATFCTIMSTSMLAALIGPRILNATPGMSGTPRMVSLASSRLKAMPEMIGCSMDSSSSRVMRVPGPSLKLCNTRSGTLYLPANSTARICSTLEPRLAISSISSKVILSRRWATDTTRGSVV
ncbi:hypothetical protein D9M73_194710 [compost metagenome]